MTRVLDAACSSPATVQPTPGERAAPPVSLSSTALHDNLARLQRDEQADRDRSAELARLRELARRD